MRAKDLSGADLSYLGDAVFTLLVKERLLEKGLRKIKDLQKGSISFVSAKGQAGIIEDLLKRDYFSQEELEYYRKGRNSITHIPRNSDLQTYASASGFESLVAYLYLEDKKRLKALMDEIL